MTGIDPGYTFFGRSLVPILIDETVEHRDAVFCEGGRLYGKEHCMEKEDNMHVDPESFYWPRVSQQPLEDGRNTKATMCRTRDFKYTRRLYENDE